MPITIYKNDLSPPARAVSMVVKILNLNADMIDLDLLQGKHLTPEYLEKNPLHTVPFLEDGDFNLVDSHAIITYLVSKYGAEKRAELYPVDLRIRATVDQRLYFEATVLFMKMRAILTTLMTEKTKEIKKELLDEVKEAYSVLEQYLKKSSFVAASHITIADISMVATVSTFDLLVPVSVEYTRIREWWEIMKEFSWYKDVNEPGIQKFRSLFS